MGDLNIHVMTLANSIIGVSILAMPYCFHQCGIILSVLMLLISSVISRLACHFLLKSAIMSRRKTFEYLAYHIFGTLGKLAIEIGMIGFLLGTCIAFFVVMGDLGPELISEITGATTSSTMRSSILMALALFAILPLGLLRNVDSLNGVSQATIGFYCCLVLKVIFAATPHIIKGDWYEKVNIWKPQGVLQCLPIFSMALFCQTQLFEIYQAVPNATLDKMNNLVRAAVNICTSVYIFVGIFGYIAFSNKVFTGNILLHFEPSFITYFMKVGFIVSVAFSFPLVIFPCRASMYSLLYREGYSVHEGVSNYIPEGKFKALTMFIVFTSLIVGIMIPNIELVLGLVGSTIGVMICVLFPVTCFICICPKNTNERLLAQFMLIIGIFVMVLGTYKNVHQVDNLEPSLDTINSKIVLKQNFNIADTEIKHIQITTIMHSATEKHKITKNLIDGKEIRHEPPQPIEPVDEIAKTRSKKEEQQNIDLKSNGKSEKFLVPNNLKGAVSNQTKNDEVDIEAIKKEEEEFKLQEKEKIQENNQILIDTIQKHNEVQQEIVELMEAIKSQQNQEVPNKVDKVKEEKLKAVKEIQNIALKAIEKISGKQENIENGNMRTDNVLNIAKNNSNRKVEKPLNTNNKKEEKKNPVNISSKMSDHDVTEKTLKEFIRGKEIPVVVNSDLVNFSKEQKKNKPFNQTEGRVNILSLVGNNISNNSASLFLNLGTINSKMGNASNSKKNVPLPVALLDKMNSIHRKNSTSDKMVQNGPKVKKIK